jgi:hypothetical protein
MRVRSSHPTTMRQEILAALLVAVPGAALAAQSNPWTVRPLPTHPDLSSAAMAYDVARQEVVLVGSGVSGFETWIWNGALWQQRGTATRPSARSGHAMAYDTVRQECVLFGGFEPTPALVGDTWTWNGTSWIQRSPAVSPAPRANHFMAFDAARGRCVLVGGTGFDDLWEWNGVAWSLTQPTTLGGGFWLGAAYSPSLQRVMMMRLGFGPTTGPVGVLTWDGATLTSISPAIAIGRLVYDGSVPGLATFSGASGTANVNRFVGGAWSATPVAWRLQGMQPQAIAFDGARNQLVVYGVGYVFDSPVRATATSGLDAVAYVGTTGASCGPVGLQLVPDPATRPLLGAVARCRIVGAPTPAFALTVGFSTQAYGPFPLPLPMDGYGMTGCILRHAADVVGVALTPVGVDLEYALAVPSNPQLAGFPLYLQGFGYAPGANPAQIALTNRLEWLVGNQ